MERRSFLIAAAGTGLAAYAGSTASPASASPNLGAIPAGRSPGRGRSPMITWTIFSRHLQWVSTQAEAHAKPYDTGVLVGEAAAEMGYTAVDLTVRPGGHVEPSMVRSHLAPMLKGVRSAGVRCRHITTGISSLESDYASDVLRAAAANGIDFYRWGTFSYPNDPPVFGKELLSYLSSLRKEVAPLAELSSRLRLTGIYHTFSGGRVGSSVWDLLTVLEGLRHDSLGLNFDIGHITAEGAAGSWSTDLRRAISSVGGVGLKDVTLSRSASGRVSSTWVPAGTGFVQLSSFFQALHDGGFAGPAEAQIEYSYNGVNLNQTFWADTLPLTRAEMLGTIGAELATYRTAALAGGWAEGEFESAP